MLNIVTNPYCPKTIRVWDPGPRPRSRRKRIRQKWEKRHGRWRDQPVAFFFPHGLPSMIGLATPPMVLVAELEP